MVEETVENCVRNLRLRARRTQKELARAAGVSRQTVIAIEKGNYIPSVLLAMKMAKFFKKPVEDVFKTDCRTAPARRVKSA